MGEGKDENWHSDIDEDSSVMEYCALSTGELLPVFWRCVVPSSLSGSSIRARRSSVFGLPEPVEEGTTFILKVGNCLPVDTA
jgi:hypothetical protein